MSYTYGQVSGSAQSFLSFATQKFPNHAAYNQQNQQDPLVSWESL